MKMAQQYESGYSYTDKTLRTVKKCTWIRFFLIALFSYCSGGGSTYVILIICEQ